MNINEILLQHPQLNHRLITLERGEMLLRAGDLVNALYIVDQGLLHAFYVGEHEEYTIRFGYSGSIITSIPAFYSGGKSLFYLQALRKTVVYAIDRSSFFQAKASDPTLASAYIASLEGLAQQQIERELDLLTTSPSERLRRVIERSPQVFQEVPLKYIASYLRMSAETLSRIFKTINLDPHQ